MQKVTIYSTQTCSYCKMAKQFFKDNKIEYTNFDVGEDEKASEEMVKKTEQMSVPVIIIEKDGKEVAADHSRMWVAQDQIVQGAV